MKDYHINIFYSDDDEGYIADIPDLKKCSAFLDSGWCAPEVLLAPKGASDPEQICGTKCPNRAFCVSN